jgi:ACS family hexuronate transporter-like MFS transporter
VGALVAPVIITLIAVYFGWRGAFVIVGSIGLLWVIAWFAFTKDDASQLKGTPFPIKKMMQVAVRVLSMKGFWMLAVSAITINSVSYYLADWIPLYLKTTRGFSFAAGNFLSIFVYAGSSCGNILAGLFVRNLANRGVDLVRAKKWVLFTSCALMLSAVAAGLTPSRYLAVVLLALTGIGVAGFLVIYLTLVQDLDPDYVGVSSGLLGGFGNLAYGFLSPYIGLLADLQKTSLTLTLIGVLPWLAFITILWGMGGKQQ